VAETLKVLGQLAAAATTAETLYTVPGATSAMVSSIVVCNRGATATTFRVSVRVAGAGADNKQYLYYDVALPANDTFVASLGIGLATTDVVTTYAGAAQVTFSLFGEEIA